MNLAKQRAPHKLIRRRVRLAWRRKEARYLFGRPEINDRFKLVALSGASAGLAVIARAISDIGRLGPAWAAVLVLLGSIVGAVVLATLAHAWLDRHFASFKSAKILGLGLIALGSFIAHGQAVGEVNDIFQVDASALPHATTAAWAMVIGTWLSRAILLPLFAISLTCAFVFYVKSRFGEFMISFAILLATITWGALIVQQAGPELRRKSNLYQIALEMDFNKRSRCLDLPDGAEGVLFIGPDQRRALVAPKKVMIPTRGQLGALVPQIEIPTSFQMVNCE